jgi:membrane protein implicated in regulation of membrane protease activity
MEPNGIGQTGFYAMHRVGLFGLSFFLVLLVLELVRRGYLKERYALLWLAVSGGALLVGLFPGIISRLSLLFGFQYLTVVYLFSFLFLLLIVLAFTVVISRLSERSRKLAQETALLDQRLRVLEDRDA